MENLLWLDLETSGLDEKCHRILEVGMFLTDDKLKVIAPEFSMVLHYDADEERMQDFPAPAVDKMHDATRLWFECKQSKYHLGDMEAAMVAYFMMHGIKKPPIIAGFGPHFDRRFLHFHLPNFERRNLHYRNFDVSTIREAVKVWAPNVDRSLGPTAHRALPDSRQAHNIALYYKDQLFDVANRYLEGNME